VSPSGLTFETVISCIADAPEMMMMIMLITICWIVDNVWELNKEILLAAQAWSVAGTWCGLPPAALHQALTCSRKLRCSCVPLHRRWLPETVSVDCRRF